MRIAVTYTSGESEVFEGCDRLVQHGNWISFWQKREGKDLQFYVSAHNVIFVSVLR